VFFAINFAASAGAFVLCLHGVIVVTAGIDGESSPFALLGGICFLGPAFVLAVAEWLLFVRRAREMERSLGLVAFSIGALATFALATTVFEGIRDGVRDDRVLGLVAAQFVVAAYSIACGAYRCRQRPDEGRGFPVNTSRGTGE
jgi:hypothetical protein